MERFFFVFLIYSRKDYKAFKNILHNFDGEFKMFAWLWQLGYPL